MNVKYYLQCFLKIFGLTILFNILIFLPFIAIYVLSGCANGAGWILFYIFQITLLFVFFIYIGNNLSWTTLDKKQINIVLSVCFVLFFALSELAIFVHTNAYNDWLVVLFNTYYSFDMYDTAFDKLLSFLDGNDQTLSVRMSVLFVLENLTRILCVKIGWEKAIL